MSTKGFSKDHSIKWKRQLLVRNLMYWINEQ